MATMELLDLDLIEEGEFKVSANEELLDLQRTLLKHIRKYGPDRTTKAATKLVITITLTRSKADPNACQVDTKFDRKTPGRPTHSTIAIADIDDDGEPGLFVRPSGSDEESPRQRKLTTNDGRAIDPETQEAKPHNPGVAIKRAASPKES